MKGKYILEQNIEEDLSVPTKVVMDCIMRERKSYKMKVQGVDHSVSIDVYHISEKRTLTMVIDNRWYDIQI